MEIAGLFFKTYCKDLSAIKVVDIGSQDVNGSLRSVAPANCEYVGVDFQEGKGVDVVIDDPYSLPLADNSADVVVCSSCFEHSEFFWLTFLEIMRILKPGGLLYLNVPSNGSYHTYPVDCWRFYPDSGLALQNWAKRNGHSAVLVESFIADRSRYKWNDFVAVFAKSESWASPAGTLMEAWGRYRNGRKFGTQEVSRPADETEDMQLISDAVRNSVKLRQRMRTFRAMFGAGAVIILALLTAPWLFSGS